MRFIRAIGLCVLALAGGMAQGQSYPNKPIHLVVPFAAGGGVDAIARVLGQKLGEGLGQPVVIDNRVGAGGSIGTAAVARAAPDGYTLLLTTIGHSIQSSMQKTPWDPVKDFAPVMQVATLPFIVVVNPAVKANSIAELVAMAKANPGKLFYGSSGVGGPLQLGMELFKSMAGVDIAHVPFTGVAPMIAAVIGGEVQTAMDSLGTSLPQVRAGKLRALAVTGAKRWPGLPDVPTMIESGLPGYEYQAWYGVLAPAGTPPGVVAQLNAELAKIAGTQEIRDRFTALGYEATAGTPAEFGALVRNDVARFAAIIKKTGIVRAD